ncbi:MAG: DUF6265 family protein [Bacteroidota bacterium]
MRFWIIRFSFGCFVLSWMACQSDLPLAKLNGNWKVSVVEGEMQENWKMINAQKLIGNCFLIVADDTVFKEQMQVHAVNGHLTYSTSFVSNGKLHETDFLLKKATSRKIVFENKTHDFPQKIAYYFYQPDSVVAKIGGKEKDTLRFELFPMKKIISN